MLINSSIIVKCFEFCDYIPFASTISNIGCLALKTKISYGFDEHFYYYLNEKAIKRSVFLLFPGIGNLGIAIYDFFNQKYANPEYMLVEIRKNHKAFLDASLRLRTDLNFLLSAIKENHEVLRYFAKNLTRNPHFMFHAIKRNPKAIDYVGASIRHPESITRLTEYILRSLGRYYHEVNVDKVLCDFSVNKCVAKFSRANSCANSERSLVEVDENYKAINGILLFNSLPKEILESIYYYLEVEDLDSFSRTVSNFKSNKFFILKTKEPLINEIKLIVNFLKKISLDPRILKYERSVINVLPNLQMMIDTNLNHGFSQVIGEFSKTIDSSYANIIRTRVLLNLRKIDVITTRVQILSNFDGSQFLSDVFNSIPQYSHYKHIK